MGYLQFAPSASSHFPCIKSSTWCRKIFYACPFNYLSCIPTPSYPRHVPARSIVASQKKSVTTRCCIQGTSITSNYIKVSYCSLKTVNISNGTNDATNYGIKNRILVFNEDIQNNVLRQWYANGTQHTANWTRAQSTKYPLLHHAQSLASATCMTEIALVNTSAFWRFEHIRVLLARLGFCFCFVFFLENLSEHLSR